MQSEPERLTHDGVMSLLMNVGDGVVRLEELATTDGEKVITIRGNPADDRWVLGLARLVQDEWVTLADGTYALTAQARDHLRRHNPAYRPGA